METWIPWLLLAVSICYLVRTMVAVLLKQPASHITVFLVLTVLLVADALTVTFFPTAWWLGGLLGVALLLTLVAMIIDAYSLWVLMAHHSEE